MLVTVDKIEVLNDVKREAEYAGMKSGDYDYVRIIDADDELLYRLIVNACTSIESELGELSVEAMTAGNTWSLRTSHDNGKDTWANVAAQSYVENKVLAEWFAMVNKKDLGTGYASKSIEKMVELRKLAYSRSIRDELRRASDCF